MELLHRLPQMRDFLTEILFFRHSLTLCYVYKITRVWYLCNKTTVKKVEKSENSVILER